jgi:hypothetical protein
MTSPAIVTVLIAKEAPISEGAEALGQWLARVAAHPHLSAHGELERAIDKVIAADNAPLLELFLNRPGIHLDPANLLMRAARHDKPSLLARAIELIAPFTKENASGRAAWMALEKAAHYGSTSCVRVLLDHAPPELYDIGLLLNDAAHGNHASVVTVLLPRSDTNQRMSALRAAFHRPALSCAEVLLPHCPLDDVVRALMQESPGRTPPHAIDGVSSHFNTEQQGELLNHFGPLTLPLMQARHTTWLLNQALGDHAPSAPRAPRV